jgi:hypothetical protein
VSWLLEGFLSSANMLFSRTAPSSSVEAKVQAAPVSTAEPSTSTYLAPSSTYVAPTSTYVAPTSTYVAPAVTTTAASSGGDWHTGGHATYFYQNGNAGACGWYKSDSDLVRVGCKFLWLANANPLQT